MPDSPAAPPRLRAALDRVEDVSARDAGALAVLVVLGFGLTAEPPVPVQLVILGLGVLTAVVSPAAAVAAALVAVPFVFEPVVVSTREFSLLELAILAGGVGIGARVAISVLDREGRTYLLGQLRPLGLTVGIAALVGVATLSLVTVAEPAYRHESLREYRVTIVEPVIFFLLARWSFKEAGARRLAGVAFVATGVVIAAVALVEVITRSGGVAADDVYRARASYPHPNNLAFYLERVGVFAAGVGVATRSLRWPLLAVAAVVLAGAAATVSRGAALGVAVGLALVVALVGRRRAWYWYGAAFAGAAVAFAFLAEGRLLATGGSGGESTRFMIWRSSLRMARDHPILGVGLDQFLYQYWLRYVEPAGWPERYTSHPHNIVLDLWLRLGILGVVVFGWLAAATVRLFRAARRRGIPDRRGIVVGAAAALVAGVVHGLVDNAFFVPDLAVMTWFFVALLAAAGDAQTERLEKRSPPCAQ